MSNESRLTDNAEEYLKMAVEKARQHYLLLKDHLEEWQRDKDFTRAIKNKSNKEVVSETE